MHAIPVYHSCVFEGPLYHSSTQINYDALNFCSKNGFKSIFSSFLLSERNMRIVYIYNFLDHENPF